MSSGKVGSIIRIPPSTLKDEDEILIQFIDTYTFIASEVKSQKKL